MDERKEFEAWFNNPDNADPDKVYILPIEAEQEIRRMVKDISLRAWEYRAALATHKPAGGDAKDAERWRWLRDLVCCSLTLSRNDDHACNYMTAEEWIRDFPEHFADCDPAEVERMMATNTIWRLQIYPNTPVGFNVWHGATPEAAIDAAIAQQGKEEAS